MKLGRLKYSSKYLAIQHFYTERHWSINWMCRQLGVTRAAYYKWLARDIPEGEKENETIAQLIREYDDRFNHILGYRRMTDWINRLNSTNYSRNRIHRIMKELKIHSVIRRKKKKYADSTPEATAENKLSRDFNAERPNQKWATDVTEFKWYEGPAVHKLYLSAILDLYDRSIVAYVVSTKNDNKLVFDTFEQSQQAMEQSMSRVGHCIDNCPTEGFWGILKAEMYYLAKFSTEVELRAAIDKYIHFYNYDRFQERFNTRTPMEVRMEVRITALASDSPEQFPIAENKRIQQYKAKYTA